ncbi:MAG: Npt1/Npt2 family nucleotide transporter [Gemmatimonadales bacterium]
MHLFERVAAWLDVRPHEVRTVHLSFFGAFLVMAFLVLARSLREALYLDFFDARTLPYITASIAVLSIPTVGLLGRALARFHPRNVLSSVVVILVTGLLVIWPFVGVGHATFARSATVAFYLWTALGTLVLTSGFWVMTSEYFPVRGAKRLFGLIGAGGTAGAMVMGNLLIWLSRDLSTSGLIPVLIGIVALFWISQRLLPRGEPTGRPEGEGRRNPTLESVTTIWRSPHLRTIAMIVFVVGIASTLLDYQFKEIAQANLESRERLTSFFGAFYGWTGGVALVMQLLVASRFLTVAGVAWTLALLPLALSFGSVWLLVFPSLLLVTAVRGTDASLRKSLYRFGLEVAYTPVPSVLRRKTKGFIDSVVDSLAEGLGAAIVFLWVTLAALPSRFLSVGVIVCSLALLYLTRRMGQRYFETVTQQLQESGDRAATPEVRRLEGAELLSSTFTRLDVRTLIRDGERVFARQLDSAEPRDSSTSPDATLSGLRSDDSDTVIRTLNESPVCADADLPELARLLARDAILEHAAAALIRCGDAVVPILSSILRDENSDFVIRRRIPRVLAAMGGREADDALLDALTANRFEVRYRAAIALTRRRSAGLPRSAKSIEMQVWEAVRLEVSRGRPVWEMQKLLDGEPAEDDLVSQRLGVRGELSLEHTFRLLSLIMEPEVVRAAFHGIILDDEKLKSFSLEYLEQVLPADVRKKLWPFIGDISDQKRRRSLRPLNEVVSDLMTTGATLFADAKDREALRQILHEQESTDD